MIDPSLRNALEQVATSQHLLVASDYDGTLAPIVDDPSDAFPLPSAHDAITRLSRLDAVDVVIISGRSEDALVRFLGQSPTMSLIGNHGARTADGSDLLLVSITRSLAAVADRFDGAAIEEKPLGAALHYRNATDRTGARSAALDAANRTGVTIIEGKEVVEAVVGHGDKGSALIDAAKARSADNIVFFGDDVTDEAAFAALPAESVTVKVGPGPTAARFRVDKPIDVAEAIEVILDVRSSRGDLSR